MHDNDAQPIVTLLAYIDTGQERFVAELAVDAADQRDVPIELTYVDATGTGAVRRIVSTLGIRAKVIDSHTPSRGRALRDAARASTCPYIALSVPGTNTVPTRLAKAVALLDAGAGLVTCDFLLADENGRLVERAESIDAGSTPPPYWHGGLIATRELFDTIATTAFHPVELDLLRRAQESGVARHASEPGFVVRRADYELARDDAKNDERRVRLARAVHADTELRASVVLVAEESGRGGRTSRATLDALHCLCRQSIEHGAFEVVVVEPRGDVSASALRNEDLPIRVRTIRRASSSRAAARNAALRIARAPLILFTDTSIRVPRDWVAEHLRAHGRAAGPSLAVVGAIDEAPNATAYGVPRVVQLRSQQYKAGRIAPVGWCASNASVQSAVLREAGGFDESFDDGATELALRMTAMGTAIVHEPRARAFRASPTTIETLRARTIASARECIRNARKHVEFARELDADSRSLAPLLSAIEGERERIERLTAGMRELAAIDVAALDRLGDRYAPLGAIVVASLVDHLPTLEAAWRRIGLADALRAEGLTSLDETIASGESPWPIWTNAAHRLFAWPDWRRGDSVRRAMELFAAAEPGRFAALVLVYDARVDGPRENALAALERAYAELFVDGQNAEIVLEETQLGPSELHRISRSIDAVLFLGSEPAGFFDLVAAERLSTTDAVRAWRDRFAGIDAPASAARSATSSQRPQRIAKAL